MNSTPLKMRPQAESSVTASPTTQPSLQLKTRLTYKASVYRWDGQWWLSARHATSACC